MSLQSDLYSYNQNLISKYVLTVNPMFPRSVLNSNIQSVCYYNQSDVLKILYIYIYLQSVLSSCNQQIYVPAIGSAFLQSVLHSFNYFCVPPISKYVLIPSPSNQSCVPTISTMFYQLVMCSFNQYYVLSISHVFLQLVLCTINQSCVPTISTMYYQSVMCSYNQYYVLLCKRYLNAAFEKQKFTQRQVQIPNTVFVIPDDFR